MPPIVEGDEDVGGGDLQDFAGALPAGERFVGGRAHGDEVAPVAQEAGQAVDVEIAPGEAADGGGGQVLEDGEGEDGAVTEAAPGGVLQWGQGDLCPLCGVARPGGHLWRLEGGAGLDVERGIEAAHNGEFAGDGGGAVAGREPARIARKVLVADGARVVLAVGEPVEMLRGIGEVHLPGGRGHVQRSSKAL